MSIDLFTANLEAMDYDDRYKAIVAFSSAQPSEGWRHDFTEIWDDSALRKVAAFANTFGGVLIVGVAKSQTDPIPKVIGVQSIVEYQTKIASSIAAGISPTPSYDIFECHAPGNPTQRFCIVRVRSSRSLHLITKKGIAPAYVRNVDESRPADASQLRGLIEREREAPTYPSNLARRAEALRDLLNVTRGRPDDTSGPLIIPPRMHSETFLKLELIRSENLSLELEKSYEDSLRSLVTRLYPRIAATAGSVATESENRGADYYEYIWYHKNVGYEVRWRITASGDLGLSSQIEYPISRGRYAWSVVDLAQHIIQFGRLAVLWSERLSNFGDGRMFVQLNIGDLTIARGPNGDFTHAVNLMHPNVQAVSIPADAIEFATSHRTAANAEINWDYFSGSNSLARFTTSILNQLLRGLGHSVLWKPLEKAVQVLVGN